MSGKGSKGIAKDVGLDVNLVKIRLTGRIMGICYI